MGKVAELLEKYNADGVYSVKLNDVLDYEQPSKYIVFSSEYNENYDIPVLTAGQTFILGYTDETEGIYKASKNNPTIIFDDFTTSYHWVAFDFKVKSSAMKMLRSRNNNSLLRYVYHSMALINYVPKEHSRQWISKYSQFEIPLPHIKVQEEIVKILDSFTNLIVALNEELALRQKQFVYYREKLLTFDEKYNKTLGSIGVFTKGNGLQKSDFVDNGYPCIHYGQIHTKYYLYTTSTISFCTHDMASKLKKAKTGDLLIASTSENVDDCCKAIAWLGDTDVAYSGDSYCFSHNEDPMYISYLFQSNKFSNQKKKFATGAKVVRVSGDSMAKIEVPIPPLEIQHSIAEKLDAFESLLSSLKDEIALRQKQYEYYREKLLTFD